MIPAIPLIIGAVGRIAAGAAARAGAGAVGQAAAGGAARAGTSAVINKYESRKNNLEQGKNDAS